MNGTITKLIKFLMEKIWLPMALVVWMACAELLALILFGVLKVR